MSIFCTLRHNLTSYILCHLVSKRTTKRKHFHNLSIDATQFSLKQLSLYPKMAAQFVRRVVSVFVFNSSLYEL
jgi:hypothetical protein